MQLVYSYGQVHGTLLNSHESLLDSLLEIIDEKSKE